AAELVGEEGHVAATHVGDRFYVELEQALCGLGPHAPQARDRERREKLGDLLGWHHQQAVRLSHVAGDLGDQLRGPYPRRRGEARTTADLVLQMTGELAGQRFVQAILRDVQIRFVERERLDQVAHLTEDLPHLSAHFY